MGRRRSRDRKTWASEEAVRKAEQKRTRRRMRRSRVAAEGEFLQEAQMGRWRWPPPPSKVEEWRLEDLEEEEWEWGRMTVLCRRG